MEHPQPLLTDHYSKLYSHEKHDSPEASRVSLVKKIVTALHDGIPNNQILDIGSGPQSLEKQLFMGRDDKSRAFLGGFHFTTLDIAEINSQKLLASKEQNVGHVLADATKLPFDNKTFGLIVSNLVLDFLPRDVFKEVHRVMAEGGKAIFFFHHPSMLPKDLNSVTNDSVRKFWKYLVETKSLFGSRGEIVATLGEFGLQTKKVVSVTDGKDTWWEVVVSKI